MEINYSNSSIFLYQFTLASHHFQVAVSTESTIPALLEKEVIDSPAPLSLLGRVKHLILGLFECIPVIGLVIALVDRFFNRSITSTLSCHPLPTLESTKALLENLNKYVVPLYRASYPDGSFRAYHGVVHAMRTVLFAIILNEIYHAAGYKISRQPNDLYMAAGLHDSERLDEGTDFWDKQSGEKCEEILKRLNRTAEEAAHLNHCIAEKDSPTPTSLEQKIIHDADCLEIIRCLSDPAGFRSSELRILKDLKGKDSHQIYALINEAKRFILLTDKTPAIKSFIDNSEEPLLNLVQILRCAHQHTNRFPVMNSYLNFENRPLPLEIQTLVCT